MDKSIKCECGNDTFGLTTRDAHWYFEQRSICPECFNEYVDMDPRVKDNANEVWMKRFNKEKKGYEVWVGYTPIYLKEKELCE